MGQPLHKAVMSFGMAPYQLWPDFRPDIDQMKQVGGVGPDTSGQAYLSDKASVLRFRMEKPYYSSWTLIQCWRYSSLSAYFSTMIASIPARAPACTDFFILHFIAFSSFVLVVKWQCYFYEPSGIYLISQLPDLLAMRTTQDQAATHGHVYVRCCFLVHFL